MRAPFTRWSFALPAPAFTTAFRRPTDDREEPLKSTHSGLTAEQSRLCFTRAPAACKLSTSIFAGGSLLGLIEPPAGSPVPLGTDQPAAATDPHENRGRCSGLREK